MEHKATKTERALCDVITSMDAQMKAKDDRISELEGDVARLTALNDGNKEIAGKLVVEKFDLLGKIEDAIKSISDDAPDYVDFVREFRAQKCKARREYAEAAYNLVQHMLPKRN